MATLGGTVPTVRIRKVRKVSKIGKTEVDREPADARSAIILAAVVTVIALYIAFFGTQTVASLDAKRMRSQSPWLTEIPQRLPAPDPGAIPPPPASGKKTALPQPTQLKAYNYQFYVPWTGKMTQTPGLLYNEFRFASGQVVDFFDPDAQIDLVRTIRESTGTTFALFQPLLGDNDITTNYDLYQAVYSASPTQITMHTSANDDQRTRILLLTKLSFGFDLERNIWSLTLGDNRAYQFGEPSSLPVALRVFNGRDKQFRFIFTVRDGSGAQLSQSEIDQAVQTLQPVPLLER